MLPIIRAAISTRGTSAVKSAATNNIKDRVSTTIQDRKTQNAERVKGLYNTLKSSNAGAHAAALATNNENGFEQKALTLLSSINGNTEELISRLTDDKKKSGLLGALLGGLGLLLTPFMGTLGKGLAVLASPFKMLAKGIGFIGTKLLALFKFLRLGNLASGAGSAVSKVAGGASKAIGAGAVKAASIAGGAGALLGKVTGTTGIKTLVKGASKMGSKLIPGVGLAVGAGFAAKRAAKGDYIGAMGEAASGIASTVPGIGTAAALAIQAGLIARDMSKKANKESEKTIRSTRKGIDAVNKNAIDTTQKQRTSFDSFTSNISEMTTKTKDSLLEGTDKMLSSIKDFMPKMFTNIGSGITSLIKSLGEWGPKIMDSIKASVAAVVKFASSPLTAVINKIQSMLPSWMGGGDSSTPLPSSTTQPTERARENFGNVRNHLKNAAGKFGVDAGLLAKVAYFESGKSFSTNAAPISSNASKNTVYNKGAGRKAISSAHGLGQFTDATWYSTLQKHGNTIGIGTGLSKAKMDSYRKNPHVQAMALAALTRDNMAASANLSGGDRAADIYVMHNLGSGKGPKFLAQLRQNPNASVRTVLSGVEIRNNPSLYGDGSISMQDAYMKMRVHLSEGQEFATAINTGAAPIPSPVQPVNNAPKSKLQKAANVAGGVIKAVSPVGLATTLIKKANEKTPPKSIAKPKATTTNSNSSYKLKMPGTPLAPTTNNSSDEFDFSNLGDPNYKPKKMGFADSLKYALNPSASGLTSNVAAKTNSKNPINKKTGKRYTNAELAAIKKKMKTPPTGPVSAGTVLIPGIGNVVKSAPSVVKSIPSAVRSIPSAVGSVYDAVTGSKSNTKPTSKTKVKDMGGNGVLAKRKDTNMNGAGVLAKPKTQTGSVSSAPVYSTAANYETDMGMGGYTIPNANMGMGDRIAATAERMVGGQTNSNFGLCARGVWFILGGAGIPGFPVTKSKSNNVNDWGASGIARARDAVGPLVQRGFREIATQGTAQNGDVDVLGPRIGAGTGHAGHIQVFANGKWYSDHVQGRRYTTDKYTWAKTFRYGADAATGEMAGSNSEPTMPGNEPEMSMTDKIAHMMTTVLSSDKLDGAKAFIKGDGPDAAKPVTDMASILPAYTGERETFYRDFGLGPNKNGTRSDNLNNVLKGSKERQWGDTTGIRDTIGFKGSKERQWPDTTGVAGTPGFQGSDDRQWGDTTGISGTPGFNGSKDRQGKSRKGKWWEGLFDGALGNILGGMFPGLQGLFGQIKSKDYAGILGTVTGMIQNSGGEQRGIFDITPSDIDGIPVPQRTSENGSFGDFGSSEILNGGFGGGTTSGDPTGLGSIISILGNGAGQKLSKHDGLGSIVKVLGGIGNGGAEIPGISNGGFGGGLNILDRVSKSLETNDYGSIATDIANSSQMRGLFGSFKSKSYGSLSNELMPSDKFITEGLGKVADINLDNKIKMQSKQSDASIITPPAQSHTVSSGSSDGAVIPISVRNNDSIIKEIAKEYLRNSL